VGGLRLFVAVALGGDARLRIDSHLSEHVPGGLPGRPTRPDQWHLTLRFLGSVAESVGDRVLGWLDQSDLGGPFTMRFGPVGAFPRPAKATVMWLGVEDGGDRLAALAAAAEDAAMSAGLQAEDRPFRPHLTLSRVRPPQDVSGLIDTIPPLDLRVPVDRMVLYQSHLGRGGATYEEVDHVAL